MAKAKGSQMWPMIKTEEVKDTDAFLAAVRDIEGAAEDIAFTVGDLLKDKASFSTTTIDFASADGFTGGKAVLKRLDDFVFFSQTETITHTSGASADTGEGFIPEEWRPVADAANVYSTDANGPFRILVQTTGRVVFNYGGSRSDNGGRANLFWKLP